VPILQTIKATGFDGVEIPVFDPSDVGHFRWLGGVLDDIGLERTVVALIPDEEHSPISVTPAHRQGAFDHMQRVIDCTEALGGQVIAGPWYQPLGVFSGAGPSEVELDHCAAFHRLVLAQFKAAGIISGLEPLNRFEAYLINTCEQAIAYAERIGSGGIGILFDTFHANIEERDPLAALRALHASGNLAHVHISENDRGTPGRGHANIRETIQELRVLGYDGWMTIEAFGQGLPELAAATRVWRKFFVDEEEVYTEGYRYIRECWG
jgi:D-psicose/D-tagatose/L-ribulose 3-epimerase